MPAPDFGDRKTISAFGDEWSRFDQNALTESERDEIFHEYFSIFPWAELPDGPTGIDFGCGSGRWAAKVAPRCKRLYCIDASLQAIEVAGRNLAEHENVELHHCDIARLPVAPDSMDFGYSLGVLHHLEDTQGALRSCISTLKIGAPMLVYLYYAFDNRPFWYRSIWKLSECARACVSRLPAVPKNLACDLLAITVYWPLSRFSRLLEMLGLESENFPLSYYRKHSLYTLRTDSRDRFGTPLEKRFTRTEVRRMMQAAGLRDVQFSEARPYWCAVGTRAE